jgi:hypothetical protein
MGVRVFRQAIGPVRRQRTKKVKVHTVHGLRPEIGVCLGHARKHE